MMSLVCVKLRANSALKLAVAELPTWFSDNSRNLIEEMTIPMGDFR